MTWMEEIGQRIWKAIDAKGMNQTDVACILDVEPQTVSRWVCGTRLLTTRHLMHLAMLLDVSTDYLLFGDEK